MDSLNISSKILYTNAKNFGIDLKSMYQSSAKEIVKKILIKYPDAKNAAIVCGLAGNGADGLAIAGEISKELKTTVYLIGRAKNIEDPIGVELWKELRKSENLEIRQDCYGENIDAHDVLIECLIGTGIEGEKLNKRFLDVIKRISRLKRPVVAIDIPTPSYKPELTISLIYPKTKDADVVELTLPKELTMYPGPGEVEVLFKPKKHSYKTQNGKLLYISNSKDFSNLNTILKYSDDYSVEVFVYSLKDLSEELKVTKVKEDELKEVLEQVDCIFLDKFDKDSLLNYGLLSEIIKYGKKYILSDSSLKFLTIDQVTLLEDKLFILDKVTAEELNIKSTGYQRAAVEFKSNLIVPSIQSYLYSQKGELRLDITGKLFNKNLQNELICLTSVFATKNETWLSLRAADFLLVNL